MESNEVTEIVRQISVALMSQVESFQQIIQGVDQINDVVQTNSALSEETAASSHEMNTQADLLNQLMSKFKV